MSKRFLGKSRMTLLAWGVLDAFYITWYSIKSMQGGRTPYLGDLEATMGLLQDQGGVNLAMAVMSWLLQLSILVSCVLFLCRYRPARYLGFAQIPLRLLFVVPSISLLLMVAPYLSGYYLVLISLVLASEVLKAWTLWKYT